MRVSRSPGHECGVEIDVAGEHHGVASGDPDAVSVYDRLGPAEVDAGDTVRVYGGFAVGVAWAHCHGATAERLEGKYLGLDLLEELEG